MEKKSTLRYLFVYVNKIAYASQKHLSISLHFVNISIPNAQSFRFHYAWIHFRKRFSPLNSRISYFFCRTDMYKCVTKQMRLILRFAFIPNSFIVALRFPSISNHTVMLCHWGSILAFNDAYSFPKFRV